MDILSILNRINNEENIGDNEFKFIYQSLTSLDSDLKISMAQRLCHIQNKQSKELLMQLTGDEDYLVRANACDSLSVFPNTDVLYILIDIAKNDTDDLVKCYAILSLRDISYNMSNENKKMIFIVMEEVLSYEDNIEVQIAAKSGLYVLGKQDELSFILMELNNSDYAVRCFTANILMDIADKKNKDLILLELKKRNGIETTNAVLSTLDYVIRTLEAIR